MKGIAKTLFLVFAWFFLSSVFSPRQPIYVKITFYSIAREKMKRTSRYKRPIFDTKGKVIKAVDSAFYQRLKIEGTGILSDGRMVQYIKTRAGIPRYTVVKDTPLGVRNIVLKPYRSVAVDPREIPFKSRLYIPAFNGKKLPDGKVHDGFFYAHDRGSAIKGKHIDIFVRKRKEIRHFRDVAAKKRLKCYIYP